jgi:hypothetical protein
MAADFDINKAKKLLFALRAHLAAAVANHNGMLDQNVFEFF